MRGAEFKSVQRAAERRARRARPKIKARVAAGDIVGAREQAQLVISATECARAANRMRLQTEAVCMHLRSGAASTRLVGQLSRFVKVMQEGTTASMEPAGVLMVCDRFSAIMEDMELAELNVGVTTAHTTQLRAEGAQDDVDTLVNTAVDAHVIAGGDRIPGAGTLPGPERIPAAPTHIPGATAEAAGLLNEAGVARNTRPQQVDPDVALAERLARLRRKHEGRRKDE